MTEIRCPHCGAARFEVLGKLILADCLFLTNRPDAPVEHCSRCGYAFDNTDRVAA